MTPWIGRWLIVVSIIHTAFAFVVFGDVLRSFVTHGLFNSVGTDPMRGAVAWFVLFGVVLFICGQVITALERATSGAVPKSIGATLLALVVLGVVLMPASGFWLALPPAVALLLRKSKTSAPTTAPSLQIN